MAFDFERAMPFARDTLYSRLRQDCGVAWDAYVSHRFVRELAAGSLPRDEFLAWMVQDYLYLVHYTRAYALLIHKSDSVAQMSAAAAIVHGLLTEEMSLHRQQLHEAGMYEIEQAPETIETLAYARYVLDRAQTGDALDLVVVLSACLAGYGEIGLRLRDDPGTQIEGNPYRDWIEMYGGSAYQALVKEGLAQLEVLGRSYGAAARYPMLLKEFLQSVRLEAAFWDAGRSALAASGR